MSLIRGRINHGITLTTAAYYNTVYISGRITNANGNGVTGQDQAWNIANYGKITGGGDGAAGVYLQLGGTVTNGIEAPNSASISGGSYGIRMGDGAGGAVFNYGTVSGSNTGVLFRFGDGIVRNGADDDTAAVITGGAQAIYFYQGSGTVINYGTVTGNVFMAAGRVTNGTIGSTAAVVTGAIYIREAATVTNYGAISGGGIGVDLGNGGRVVNGAGGATAALISGNSTGVGALSGYGTITNYGTISGFLYGVYLGHGGSVTNGASGSSTAQIHSSVVGIKVLSRPGTITNFGTVSSTYADTSVGIMLSTGGTVTNGASGSTAALISGKSAGVFIAGFGTVDNSGTILGDAAAVFLYDGGVLTNGTAASTPALISAASYGVELLATGSRLVNGSPLSTKATIRGGYDGVLSTGGTTSTISNFGTIAGTDVNGFGLDLRGGGRFTNGAATSTAAQVRGLVGIDVTGGLGSITNFGTIVGSGGGSVGVSLGAGGTLTNGRGGGSSSTAASISGRHAGLVLGGAGIINNFGTIAGNNPFQTSTGILIAASNTADNTITNYGTIRGTTAAIKFGVGNDVLNVESGAVFSGTVNGGGGYDTVFLSLSSPNITNFTGFEAFSFGQFAAGTAVLTDANFTAVIGNTITVNGSNKGGDLLDASAVSVANTAVLRGGAGADTLIAGQHARLIGGIDGDSFVFTTPGSVATPNQNIVTDFVSGTDTIKFSIAGFGSGLSGDTAGALPAVQFGTSPTGGFSNASQRFVYNTTNGRLMYDPDGKTVGGAAAVVVATLTGHPTLALSDLFLVS